MVGFSLKKKETKASKFSGFSLNKGNNISKNSLPKKSAFGSTNDDDDDDIKVKIDTFDKESGAYDEKTGPEKPKGALVITNAGNHDWKRAAKERYNPQQTHHNEAEPKKSLEYGINFIENRSSKQDNRSTTVLMQQKKNDTNSFRDDIAKRPDTSSLEEYEEIPIEDFGAAMLRGMGWKEEDDNKSKSKKEEKQVRRSQYLGIGAKALPGNSSVDKFYNPVKKVDRETGKVIEDREREASPNRINNYKERS